MKFSFTAAALSALASTASAAYCQNLTIPVTISARNGVFKVQAPTTNLEVTNFILTLGRQGTNYSQAALEGYATVSGTYDIAATLCQPVRGIAKVLQILTHGIGFDRSYWDPPYNNYNYSYVREAVDTFGYATFAWDRLGIGMSSHGDPVNVIQAPLEVAALAYLTNCLKSNNCLDIVYKPEKVVHVGHSFGSEHTYLLTAMYPGISDGIALTGFSQNGSFVPYFEFGGNFVDAPTAGLSSYAHGYLAAGDPSAVQTNFFAPGDFDPNILPFAYTTGQPVTIGELLTIGGETAVPNTFAGPVVIVTGEYDIPYCGGNCFATGGAGSSIPSMAFKTLPNATRPTAYIVPGAGHGLNLQYSHTFAFDAIFSYFNETGLAP